MLKKLSVLPLVLLLPLATGCARTPLPNDGAAQALAETVRPLMKDHAAALVEDGGDKSVVTGAVLIHALEAGLPQ